MLYLSVALLSFSFSAPLRVPHAAVSVRMQHDGKGFGGGEATRDPEPTALDPNDPKGKQQAIHKAESFSEYLAKRAAGVEAPPPDADEATRDEAPAAAPAPAAAGGGGGGVTAGIVTGWQPAALSKVVSTLGLTAKPYAADYSMDSFTMGGSTGNIESYEGPGVPNVAWCSGLTMSGDVERGALSAFCGPLTDVPHLVCACGVSNGGIDLYIDWRARAESGYEPGLSLADYPEPTTREAFAEGSNRKDFEATFYTEAASAITAPLLAAGTPAPALSKEVMSAISAGPLMVDVRLPLDDASATAAADACTAAVDLWLSWMTGAEEMKRSLPAGMRQTATYTRDTKVRANHFGFLIGKYSAIFGDVEGKALAEADAGPLDEAYVGGGS